MPSYLAAIVGEGSYQLAVKSCRVGDTARIVPEPDNPHDPKALRVLVRGATIGYIARSHWLQSAIHEQGKTVAAKVDEVTGTGRQHRGIVLSVSVLPRDTNEPKRGLLARLFGG